jgi:leucine efflux protein
MYLIHGRRLVPSRYPVVRFGFCLDSIVFYGVTDLTTFVLGTIFIVLLPGPNSLYVMTLASRFGVMAGVRGAAGIFVGDLILMILAATGVASLFQANPALFVALKYAGAAYLVFLGLGLLRSAVARWRGLEEATAERRDVGPGRPFRVALAISLMNPKAILFYVSFFIQFVSPTYPYPALSFLILGSVVQICSMLYLSVLIVGGTFLAETFRSRRKLSATATGGVGSLFIGFGAKLAGAGLS